MSDFYTRQIKEVEAKQAVDLAKVAAQAAVQAAGAEARSREALIRAETELIKTRAEHADNERMLACEARALEQMRLRGQTQMVLVGSGTLLISVVLISALVVCR